MFSVTTGEQTRILQGHTGKVIGIAVNPENPLQVCTMILYVKPKRNIRKSNFCCVEIDFFGLFRSLTSLPSSCVYSAFDLNAALYI
jgi:hypothetical protein